jgi:glycosyltransferase involved in cell wall biosynthesis
MSGQTIVAVSSDLATALAKHSPRGRIVVIENGVDIEALRAQVGSSRSAIGRSDVTRIGIVGRLVPVKRVDLFLEMAQCLLKVEPTRNWKFEVFGDGPERERLEALCNRLELGRHVTFHGHREDIAKGMSGLDVLVMCSDHEGMPMAALEAAALGVPTVAHAVGGLIDAVPMEFQVTRHDPRGYCEAVLRALHGDARAATAKHARRVLERFSAERNGERTLALYRELLSRGANGEVTG